jgi:hypothetical protein
VLLGSAVHLAKEDWDKAEADATKCVELNDVFVKGEPLQIKKHITVHTPHNWP